MPLVLLALLFAACLAAVAYRKYVTKDEDDLVHLGEGSVQHAAKQEAMAKSITQLDKIVKTLIVVTAVYGLGLGAFAIYQALQNGPSPA